MTSSPLAALMHAARLIPVLTIPSEAVDVPLARALYATADIDKEIPVEHYHAVAEVIGYVIRLKRGFSAARQ